MDVNESCARPAPVGKPPVPPVEAFAGGGGQCDELHIGIDRFRVARTGFEIEVHVRQQIHLVDDDQIRGREGRVGVYQLRIDDE